jgi:hypothetical protein
MHQLMSFLCDDEDQFETYSCSYCDENNWMQPSG